jgi:DCN1-like protein 1/2
MPAAYSAQQRTAIAEFAAVTNSDKSTAAKFLKQHHWNTSAAING